MPHWLKIRPTEDAGTKVVRDGSISPGRGRDTADSENSSEDMRSSSPFSPETLESKSINTSNGKTHFNFISSCPSLNILILSSGALSDFIPARQDSEPVLPHIFLPERGSEGLRRQSGDHC